MALWIRLRPRGQHLHISSLVRNSIIWYSFFNVSKCIFGLGVSLSWLGLVPPNASLTPTSAIYSIDGQTPISFFVPALSASNALPLYNQVFFKTDTLSPGQHELKVTYQGHPGTAPLLLDAFVVQNASATSALTSVPGATSATSFSVPSSSSTSNPWSKKSPLVGAISGAVGGVIVLVLLLLLYISRRHGNNRRAQKLKEKDLYTNPEPFTLSQQTYTSEVPYLTPLHFPRKFSQRIEPPQANAPGSTRHTPPPLIGARIDPTTSNSAIQNTETIPVLQPPTSSQGVDPKFLRHADSGVRMPQVQASLDELPPVYSRSWCCFSFKSISIVK